MSSFSISIKAAKAITNVNASNTLKERVTLSVTAVTALPEGELRLSKKLFRPEATAPSGEERQKALDSPEAISGELLNPEFWSRLTRSTLIPSRRGRRVRLMTW